MQGIHPLNLDVVPPARVARWRPLANWVLVAPASLWLAVLTVGAEVVAVCGWFAIVLTGRLPDSWGDYLVGVLRYQWRVAAFLYGWTERRPGFAVPAGHVDPGDHPAILYSARPLRRSRPGALARLLLAAPHLAALVALGLAEAAVLTAAWVAVVALGRWPEPMRRFAVGAMRWQARVTAYVWLVVDVYPPFAFEA